MSDSNFNTHAQIRAQYIEFDYDCIPLQPMSKLPVAKGWQTKAPASQWRNSPAHANFGLRAGNGRAFIDADDKNAPGTLDNVTRWLDGLGYTRGRYPVVRTASGLGGHIYVNFSGMALGNYSTFSASFGAGEFRYGAGAYVVAPPSMLPNGQYELVEGDLLHLPTLTARDIKTLTGKELPTGEKRKRMSSLASMLAEGKLQERYQSASDAEAALVLSLINSAYTFEEIQHVFDTHPCAGKYGRLRRQEQQLADAYLLLTYQNAREYAHNESPTRRAIRELREQAELAPWKKSSDLIVYLAHLAIADKSGKFTYAAAVRDLALQAGVGRDAANKATYRLIGNGMLALTEPYSPQKPTCPAVYTLAGVDKNGHSLKSTCEGVSDFDHPLDASVAQDGLIVDLAGLQSADAFRNGRGRLGRRAGQIYKLLFLEALTVPEIAKRTGASVKTVRRTLARMTKLRNYKTGEVLDLVERDEANRWHSRTVDLEIVEAVLHTYGARGKQAAEYEKERRARRKQLDLGQLEVR